MKQFKVLAILFAVLMTGISQGQRKNRNNVEPQGEPLVLAPKLVVGIVVDQMRYDYLTRFWDQYGEGGFKRLVSEGFTCKNHHFNYAPTSTGPGHTSVYTGTTPATHGIIGNNWFDKQTGEMVYCAGDDSYTTIGSSSQEGQ